jgi:hypothetical protein
MAHQKAVKAKIATALAWRSEREDLFFAGALLREVFFGARVGYVKEAIHKLKKMPANIRNWRKPVSGGKG